MLRTTLLLLFLGALSACADTPSKEPAKTQPAAKTAEATTPPSKTKAKAPKKMEEKAETKKREGTLNLPKDWSADNYSKMEIGKPLPDWFLPDTDGNIRRFSEFRGKKVLLINFASW